MEPELKTLDDQAIAPTLPSCPFNVLISLHLFTSHTYTTPLLVPIDKWCPLLDQHTDVTQSRGPRSYNFVTLLLLADQIYIQLESPTARLL